MNRRLAAAALFALLAASAGCLGSGSVNEERLAENVTYDWEVRANATFTIQADRYDAVYRVRNQSTFELYRFRRLNQRRPVDPIGPKFRFPNGTVVGHRALDVSKEGSKTVLELPAENGTLGVGIQKSGKEVRIPKLIEGSHEVILPANAHVEYPLISHVVPRDHEVTRVEGRPHIFWEDVSGDRLRVKYYLTLDVALFGGLLAGAGIAIAFGVGYFWVQIRKLRRRRERVEIGEGPER